ncbi:MAG: hypothetical protein KJ601_05600 [Nanoarchaeota archaeon]|nr:hypothetical protein [Nanoarchaeota archaeon]
MAELTQDPPKPDKSAAPASKGINLFGAPKKPAIGSQEIAQIVEDVNNVSTRLKILEERYENLRKKLQVIEQNMLENNKKVLLEVKTSEEEIKEFNKVMEQMKQDLRLIIRELKLTAKNDEVQVLKKYIQVWEPLNFVQRKELDKILNELIEDKLEDLSIRLQEQGFIEDMIRTTLKKVLGEKGLG